MAKLTVNQNGPLKVEGDFTLEDMAGNTYESAAGKKAVFICRCGQTNNPPFCDGAHKACGFESPSQAF